jgi:hypothetical protein
MNWSTVLLQARLSQDPSVGQLSSNTIPLHFQRSSLAVPWKKIMGSDMTDFGRQQSCDVDRQKGNLANTSVRRIDICRYSQEVILSAITNFRIDIHLSLIQAQHWLTQCPNLFVVCRHTSSSQHFPLKSIFFLDPHLLHLRPFSFNIRPRVAVFSHN